MRKILKPIAVIVMAGLLLCGCAQTSGRSNNGTVVTDSLEGKPVLVGNIPCEFPLVTGDEALNILITGYEGVDQNSVYVWNKYKEMTGVDVNWTTVSKDNRREAVESALLNKQNLDLIMRCKISANRLTQYGESGLILDLAKDDLLKTYAPNCWAYLQSHPETLASVMNPDGSIYSLPQVNSGAELRVSLKLFVNKNWLENLGMELPTSTEEFYNLLKAFKTRDANGNGDVDDEIPFCCVNWQSVQQSMYGAFGLGNRGIHNETVDCDEATGKVRLTAASDDYRSYLEYMHRLYSEGLLDQHAFTVTTQQWSSELASDQIGVFASTNLAWVPADQTGNWVAIGEALEGPNGDKLWTAIRADFHSTGAAVIPSTCKDPALALKWLDYFWTDEGTLFYHMGIDGETFVSNADGTYDYAPAIYDQINSGNKSFDDVVATYSPYPGGSNPTVEIAPYFMGGEMAEVPAQAARSLFEYGPKEYWPSFTFTVEENDSLNTLKTDIEKYCQAMEIEFITGSEPLSSWSEYISLLEKLNMSDMLDIYQAAVDRYHALGTAKG